MLNFLTDFADQAVVLPLAACVLLALLAMGWARGAVAWGASVAGVLAAMLVLKLVCLACGRQVGWTGLVSPSGHTAAAAVVYGGLATLLIRRGRGLTWPVAAGAGGAAALVVGLTRLALHVHTLADVVVGGTVGIAGAVLMRRMAGARPERRGLRWLLVPACVVVLVFHGDRLQAEQRLHWIALDVWPLDRCR